MYILVHIFQVVQLQKSVFQKKNINSYTLQ